MKLKSMIVFLGVVILIEISFIPLHAQYPRIKTRSMLWMDYYDANKEFRDQIFERGGNEWFGLSIRQIDSTGNVVKETAPIFSLVHKNDSCDHIIGIVSSLLGINENRHLVICYDMNLNVKLIFPPEIQSATLFSRGTSFVSTDVLGERDYGIIDTAGNYIFRPENDVVFQSGDTCCAIRTICRQDRYEKYRFDIKMLSGGASGCDIYIPYEVFPVIMFPQFRNWQQFWSDEDSRIAKLTFNENKALGQFHDGISDMISMKWLRAGKCFKKVILLTDDEILRNLARKNLKEVRRMSWGRIGRRI